jgi:ABC-2 type transport system permease protein
MRAANRTGDGASTDVDENGRKRNAARRARRLARKQADAMPVAPALAGPKVERVVDAPLVSPAPQGGILEVFQHPYLLRLIVGRQLAAMYAASVLGLLWSYIQPAMRFVVYYMIFGYVLKLHQGFPSFAIHLFCGIVFVHYFTETWAGGTRSIRQNRALVLKMRMPRETFPVAAMVVAAYHTFPQTLLLVVFCVLTGWHVTLGGLAAGALGLAILMTFSMALGLLFSALNVLYKDFQNIVQTMLQFMHFLVPMMYPFSMIWNAQESHPVIYQIYMANPVAEAVLLMQRLFWWDVVPESAKEGHHLVGHAASGGAVQFPPDLWTRGLIMLAISMLLMWSAQRFFSRVENKFPERL